MRAGAEVDYAGAIMKKIVAIVVVLAVLAGLSYWCASHHVVKTDPGVLVLSKRFLTGADTFVDVRKWSSADFDAHPELKRALAEGGYADLLAELKAQERLAALDDMKVKAAALAEDVAAKVSETAGEVADQVSAKAEDVAEKVAEKLGKE